MSASTSFTLRVNFYAALALPRDVSRWDHLYLAELDANVRTLSGAATRAASCPDAIRHRP